MRTFWLAFLIGAMMAAVGWVAAKADIWFYHLGPAQSALAIWAVPIALAIIGAIYGGMLAKRD